MPITKTLDTLLSTQTPHPHPTPTTQSSHHKERKTTTNHQPQTQPATHKSNQPDPQPPTGDKEKHYPPTTTPVKPTSSDLHHTPIKRRNLNGNFHLVASAQAPPATRIHHRPTLQRSAPASLGWATPPPARKMASRSQGAAPASPMDVGQHLIRGAGPHPRTVPAEAPHPASQRPSASGNHHPQACDPISRRGEPRPSRPM